MSRESDVAEHVLSCIRAVVAARVRTRVADAGERVDRVAAELERDPGARAALERAASARRDLDPLDPSRQERSARRDRIARQGEVHEAAGALVRQRRLVQDGPDRVSLPGFGPATWRALWMLDDAVTGPRRSWAEAVALAGLTSLGTDARVDPPDPRLAEAAHAVHLLESVRQELRHALLTDEAAIGVALDAGHGAGVASLRADCERHEQQIAEVDALLLRAWKEGGETAFRYAPAA